MGIHPEGMNISKRYPQYQVQCSIIHNRQDMETQASVNGWVDKDDFIFYTYTHTHMYKMEYYPAMLKKTMPFVKIRMPFEGIMLSQTQVKLRVSNTV